MSLSQSTIRFAAPYAHAHPDLHSDGHHDPTTPYPAHGGTPGEGATSRDATSPFPLRRPFSWKLRLPDVDATDTDLKLGSQSSFSLVFDTYALSHELELRVLVVLAG